MANPLIDIIDTRSTNASEMMNLSAQAIEGLYSQHYRANPSMRGLALFLSESEQAVSIAGDFIVDGMTFLTEALDEHGVVPSYDPEIVRETLQALVHQLRYVAARRYRAAVVSRSSVAPTLSGSLRVLNRAGQSFNAREMLYLATRKAMLDATNEGILEKLRRQGQTVAEVIHVNPEHVTHGALVAVLPEMTGIPAYTDVAEKWFHPRASATLNWS